MLKKRILSIWLALTLCVLPAFAAPAAPDVAAPSAVLMEKVTGRILAEKNAHEKLPPASVTKVMSLLLFMEAIDAGTLRMDEVITASKTASGMGGSQIWLKENEQMTVDELLKAIVVASANDCTVALAEHIAGSEQAFVARMNEKAAALGMNDTTFLNCTGLDAQGHVTSAWDIALMSRELIKHEKIKQYTTIWMDSLRGGKFQLSNTNRLIRHYSGATGLKTGSTSIAKYCLSATAERDGMELIATVMAAPTTDDRFGSARALLDFGFANYALVSAYPDEALPPVSVNLGKLPQVQPVLDSEEKMLIEKIHVKTLEKKVAMLECVDAPVAKGQKLGEMTVSAGGEVIATVPIIACEQVAKLTLWDVFTKAMSVLLMA